VIDAIPIIDVMLRSTNARQFSNKLAGMDARVRFPQKRGLEVYADGLMDDFDYRRLPGLLWDDTGWIAGFVVNRLRTDGGVQLAGEYHHTGLRYYQHTQFTSGVTFDDRILGDDLGPRSNAGYARLSWDVGAASSLSLNGAYERRGHDLYRTVWVDSLAGRWRFEKIASRPPETRSRVELTWAGELSPRRPRVFATLGYEHVDNFAFAGRSRDNALVRVGVEQRF
jgi:hypothetical protein